MSDVMDRPSTLTGKLFDLTGKVAVITGSSRGIGKAIAEQHGRARRQGGDLVAQGRPLRGGGRGDQRASSAGHAIAVPANISSKDDLQRLVDETRKAFGKIDILVCNAASNPYYGADARHHRRRVPQDPRQQHRLQQLADPDGRAGDARAEGRRDHHRLVDRRPARHRR